MRKERYMNQIFLELMKMLTDLLPYLFLKGVCLLALIIIFPKLVKHFIHFLDKIMVKRGFEELLISFVESLVSTLGYIILFFSAVGILGVKATRSEEHTSELQSRQYLVCRLLLEKKKNA